MTQKMVTHKSDYLPDPYQEKVPDEYAFNSAYVTVNQEIRRAIENNSMSDLIGVWGWIESQHGGEITSFALEDGSVLEWPRDSEYPVLIERRELNALK